MVVSDAIHNIMGGIENTGDVRLHNHRKKLKQRFDIVKKLGQGTYGKVQLGLNKETGQEVAIKTIRKSKIENEADLIRIRREIQIMSSVRHPNIIHIYEVFENKEKIVLVMEYAAGGELYDYLSERKVLSEEEARRIFRQISTAVYYCHKHNICHRDLKLENILLDEIGNAKIADFGLSNVFSYNSLLSTFCGSPLYASPEIVKGTPYHGPEVDCWSLGVLLYTLVYGAMPFDGSNFKRLVKQISHGDYFEPKSPSPASPLISEMLNVNPARRADISAICSHWWINETYSEMCLDVAEELASQTPVRLDLLLSISAPSVNNEKIIVDNDSIVDGELNGSLDRPIRSQSLGSIAPANNTAVFPLPELKEVQEERKLRVKKNEPIPQNKISKKERSQSRTRKSSDPKLSEETKVSPTEEEQIPLINSETQIIVKPSIPEKINEPPLSSPVSETKPKLDNSFKIENNVVEPSKTTANERNKSKVLKMTEKLNAANETSKKIPMKKPVASDVKVDNKKKEPLREKRISEAPIPAYTSPSTGKKASDLSDDAFPLASTVTLNKLVESAFKDEEPPFVKAPVSDENIKTTIDQDVSNKIETKANVAADVNKAATLPRRKTSRAEIQLAPPQLPADKFVTEVEHVIKPIVNHKTEVVFPVSAPLPPKPLTKQDNQSKEHIIPIQFEQELQKKVISPTASWIASKSSIARTSSSSLSRQSTVDSDSGSTISTGEPIRKSAREVIIPIAVEGGGFVTPSEDTLNKINSRGDSEDDSRNGSRCFTLRSTKRRPHKEESHSSQLDAADSLSSDEDDNFQLLTAENLFSTLLSRVRSLTQRLNNDEMRRSSAFPRSLFSHHNSLFDSMPTRRLTETRSFSRSENAPWRHISNSPSARDDKTNSRYSRLRRSINEPENIIKPGSNDCISDTTNNKNNDNNNNNSNNKLLVTPLSIAKNSNINCTMDETQNLSSKSKDDDKNTNLIFPNALRARANKSTSISNEKTSEVVDQRKPNIEEEFNSFFSKYKKPFNSSSASVILRKHKFDNDKADSTTSTGTRISPSFRRSMTSEYTDITNKLNDLINASKRTSTSSKSPETSLSDDEKIKSSKPRKSRFLRPDFYDTPLEDSKYVIKNEKVRAFRERSASRQRNLCRNRTSDLCATNGLGTDYVRSKTCSLGSVDDGHGNTERKYHRSVSEDLPPQPVIRRYNSTKDSLDYRAEHRKSLILQSELENEMRKTKNINSKLTGLLSALSATENQYEKRLERLYGNDVSAADKSKASDRTVSSLSVPELSKITDKSDFSSDKADNATRNNEINYNKLSLIEKKQAYFKKLQADSDVAGNSASGNSLSDNVAGKQCSSAATSVADETNISATTESASVTSHNKKASQSMTSAEERDNDLLRASNSPELSCPDSVNDRIRRRSFYSRFNIYNMSPPVLSQTSTALSDTPRRSKLLTSYSRSLSADYKPRSSSSSRPL